MHLTRHQLIFIIYLLLTGMPLILNAQGLSGPTSTVVGSQEEYVYFDDVILTSPSWGVSNGSIISSYQSGSTYYCTVLWHTAGAQSISFFNGGIVYGYLDVSVISCPAVTPSTTFSYSSNSANAVITRNTNPPSGTVWYWQNSPNGTSTTIGSSSSLQATSGNSYYLRAYNTSYSCWSTNSLATATIPGNPSVINGTRCGSGQVNLSATPGTTGTTIRWYAASSGGSVLATSNNYNPTVTTSTTFYAVSFDSSTGAEGLRFPVTATVHTPSAGGVLSSSSHDGTGNFSPKGTLTLSQHNGAVVRWERNAGNGWQIIPHTPNQPTYSYLNLRSSASYRAIVQNGTCSEAPSAEVKIEVISLPYSASSSLQALPGTNYQWYKGDILVTGATGQILPISESGVYTVKETSVNPHRTTGVFYVYPPAFRQVQRVNAFSSVSILKAGVTETTSLYTLQPHELAQQVAYKDGLGKVFQIVDVGGSPQQTDIVLPSGVGRQGLIDTTYLPYVSANRDGRYRPYGIKGSNNAYTSSEQYQFYQNTPKVAQDNYPFARTLYRNTPDAKVTEQGAPGADWQPGSGRTVRNVLALNTATGDYAVKYWKPDGTTTGNYPANSVVVSITTDENGNKVHTYTNALGQTVLKQVQEGNNSWLETYYIYDEFGRLKYQVPPKALEALGSGTDVKVTALAELIYTYTYDARHRLVEKKVPGAAVQYLVYDKLDRVVLTQDGNLRNSSNWIFVKYDRYNRIAYTGIYKNTAQTTRTAVQALVDQENYSTTPWYETEGTTVHGYTNLAWPTAGTVANTILSVNYYDHYDFDRNGTADYSFVTNHLTGQETTASAKTRGLPTGSKRVVLDATGNPTATWLIGIVFYDQYDRPIQTRSNNHLYTTVADIATVIYDFSGKTVKSKTTHYQNATTSVSFTDRNEYDHAGRVLKTFRQINSNPEQLLAQYEYNALGQVVDKKLHDSGGGNFLQSVDLRYTIRGWLRSINNSQLTSDGLLNDDANDYFGMEVLYNSVETGLANTPYYNGNISAIKWKGPGTSGAADQRSYKYSYDKTDRLTAATFQAYTGTATNGTWTKETGTLNETITYDKNGNITALSRYQNLRGLSGTAVTATPQVMDQLTYTYGANSNQLVKVDDAATVTTGFVNGANNTTEYSYTADGSLAKDDNKGIQSITYNFLGKPQVILYTDGRKVEYVYDAAGTKLTMKTWQGTTLLACTNYSGSFVYEGATPQLSFFGSPEGRVVKNGSNFEYQYALADHQGNTRVLFSAATPAPQAVTANMEASANSNFLNYTNRISFNLFDHTDAGTTYTYAQKLTGGHNSQVGVAKSYKVYPGDKVKIEAWAKYQNPSGTGSNLANFAGALLSAFGLAPPAGGETGTPSAALNTWGSLVAGGNGGNSTGPKAFVNIIVFDKNYKLLDFAWDAIDPSAHQVGASPVVPHDYMSLEYVAKEEGYAYLYVSNENPTLVDVYFDDVVMTHTKSNVIQYNEYYPFGLQTANSWTREGAVDNKFLYNGGTELNSTTQLYDLFYRNYDPVLGRMNQVDPVFEHIEDIRRRLVSNEQ